MRIQELLQGKGHSVVTITEEKTVLDAVQVLVEHNIGGVVVTKEGQPTGIITERDILRLTARAPAELGSIQVGEVMTRELITARSDDLVTALMDVMTENRIRHVPIVDEDRLTGIISIGDVLNACRAESDAENSQLRKYIQGVDVG